MSRKIIAIAATLVAIGILTAGLILLQNEPAPEPDNGYTPSETTYVLGGPVAESPAALSITVQNEHGSYTLRNDKPGEAKSAQDYTLLGYEGIATDSYELLGVVDRVVSLAAREIVSEEGGPLADYGLARPSARVEVSYADGSSATLLVGNKAPGSNGTYVMREGSPAVYLIYQTAADYFTTGALQLLDRTITTGNTMASSILQATLGGTVRPTEVVIDATPEKETEAGGMKLFTHDIVSPVKAGLHVVHGLEPLMRVFALNATDIAAKIDNPSELAKWGLDTPYSTISIRAQEEGTFKLLASEPNAEGNVYLMREGVPVVYIVPKGDVPWLSIDVFTLMDKMMIIPFIDTVKAVTVRTPSQEVHIGLDGEDDELTVTVNGALYEDTKNFRTFYQTLLSASYESYTDEPLPENAQLLLQYTYEYRNASPASVVSFYQGASRKVFAQLDKNAPLYVLSSYVDRVVADLAKFAAGETVIPYL